VSQLGVAVWDVGGLQQTLIKQCSVANTPHLLSERHDDVAEVGEALVDGLGLGQPHALAPAVLDPLAAGQVHLGNGPSPS
jgi:hypothetical protein